MKGWRVKKGGFCSFLFLFAGMSSSWLTRKFLPTYGFVVDWWVEVLEYIFSL